MSESEDPPTRSRRPGENMERAYYFPFRVKEWLADERFTLMSAEQKGALIDLWARAWVSDPPCTLPDDDRSLAQLSGLQKGWKRNASVLRALFEPMSGRLVSPDLLRLHVQMVEQSERKSRAGKAGNAKRWGGTTDVSSRGAIPDGSHQELELKPELETQTVSAAHAARETSIEEEGSWEDQFNQRWRSLFGGPLPVTSFRKVVGPLVEEHGIGEILRRLQNFKHQTPIQFATIGAFVSKFNGWVTSSASLKKPVPRHSSADFYRPGEPVVGEMW